MWFSQLDIQHVRNLESVHLELVSGLNYLFGANGAGKTAVLEAIHLLARGRSFRGAQAADLIQRDHDALTVHAVVEDELRGRQRIGLGRARGGRTELHINGEPGRKLSQAAALLPLQVLVPSLSDLVFAGPGERRQWLDWGVFHVEHDYLAVLRSYLHAIRQRNAALKSVAAGRLRIEALDPWSEEAAKLGTRVDEARSRYLQRLAPMVQQSVAALAPELDLEIVYRRGWPLDQDLRKVLGDSVATEVKWGVTRSGPHRGDVDLRVAGQPAASCLSRGQGKSLASALMLAQAELLREAANRTSVFLIDDIGAELDLPHSARFFQLLSELGSQILATSTGPLDALGSLPRVTTAVFHVEHGTIRQVEPD